MSSASPSRIDLGTMLERLNVAKGDVLYLGVDISKLPLPKIETRLDKAAFAAREAQWCEFVAETLLDAIGPTGTLVFPTFTFSCGRPENAYRHETTPSEVSRFFEFLRLSPGARRSLHPIFSVGALGAAAGSIVDDVGKAAFGAASPFGRLHDAGARFLCLGTTLARSLTYAHHLEQTYGCSNRYSKTFDTAVYRGGALVPGPWLAYVNYRCTGAVADLARFERRLIEEGVVSSVEHGGYVSQSATAADVSRIGYRMLAEDPSSFMDVKVRIDMVGDDAAGSTPTVMSRRVE